VVELLCRTQIHSVVSTAILVSGYLSADSSGIPVASRVCEHRWIRDLCALEPYSSQCETHIVSFFFFSFSIFFHTSVLAIHHRVDKFLRPCEF
jgi:hypothetical protein